MSLYRVPQSEWGAFCSRFTGRHRGEGLVAEPALGSVNGPAVHGRLDSLRVTRGDDQHTLVVYLFDTPRGTTRFVVDNPSSIELSQQDPSKPGSIVIEAGSRDRELTLRFDQPLVHGELDGVVPPEVASATRAPGANGDTRGRKRRRVIPRFPRPRQPLSPGGLQLFAILVTGLLLLLIGLFYVMEPNGFFDRFG